MNEEDVKVVANRLVGKTIESVEVKGLEGFDDVPFLILKMTDGSVYEIEADYNGYSGESQDEYQRLIEIREITPVTHDWFGRLKRRRSNERREKRHYSNETAIL
jgi:hypothetical protein